MQSSNPLAAAGRFMLLGTNVRRRRSRMRSGSSERRTKFALECLEPRRVLAPIVPAYNSDLAAPVDLYLDFDGHFQAAWGSESNLVTPVFDTDGDPESFNQEELDKIHEIWSRMSEDFAPFNINVTTVEPTVLAEGADENDANGVALRIAFGDTAGYTSGGRALVDAFTDSDPNTVYSHGSAISAESLANTGSHEAGHGFGLLHQSFYDDDGNLVDEYYPGDAEWSPIMGGGNGRINTWHYGTSLSSTTFQDDMNVLARQQNGFGYRDDDFGDSPASAQLLSGEGVLAATGLIGQNDDVDFFQFSVETANSYQFLVDGAGYGQNLDAVLELTDSAGQSIRLADPDDSIDADFSAALPPGDYFVAVGKTDRYGALGQYTLTIQNGGAKLESLQLLATPGAGGSKSRVKFSHPIDPLTFTASDVLVTAPDQSSQAVAAIEEVVGSGGREFDIVLDAQSAPGVYQVRIGPDILDVSGYSMDQDFDGNAGEVEDDVFTGWIQVAEHDVGWAFSMAAGSNVQRAAIDVGDGYVYVAGNFRGSVDFDPGPNEMILTDRGGDVGDGFIAKYTRDRQLVWARSFGGASGEASYDVAVDSGGNVFLTGATASPTLEFGSISVSKYSRTDGFVAKLNSDGEFQWAHVIGGADDDWFTRLTTTSEGGVVVAGGFFQTVDFDPGPGTVLRTAQDRDGVAVKFGPFGEMEWVWTYGGPAWEAFGVSVDADSNDNIYIAGGFRDTAHFDGGPSLTSAGNNDGFVTKLDSSGDFQWIRQLSGAGETNASLGVDQAGNVTVAGYFESNVNLGPGAPELTGSSDAYIVQLDTNNNYRWSATIAGEGKNTVGRIAADPAGNILLSGKFEGPLDLDPGPGESWRQPIDGDSFLLKLDGAAGDFLWSRQLSGKGSSQISVAEDAAGSIYITGQFDGQLTTPTGEIFSPATPANLVLRFDMQPSISVVPLGNHVTTEDGGQAQFGVVLSTQPTANVTVPISSSDVGEGSVDSASLIFTPENWKTPQIVTVTGVDDGSVDLDASYTINFGPATSADPTYNGLDAPDVKFVNLDNDEPLVLFSDSFEVGAWNGLWVSGAQNDWFRSTQRAIDGAWSAEVDGSASNAALSLATPINLTPYGDVELTFSWYLENGFDAGEYLALDFFDGNAWQEVRRLRGNIDQEDVWHLETVAIDGSFLTANFQMRFRATVSHSNEDANVDLVQLVATSLANLPPTAASDNYSVSEDGILTISTPGVLTNDTDPEGDPLHAVLASGARNGAVTLNADGSLSYTPNANFNGVDSFTYRASDGMANSAPVTVYLTVDSLPDAPVANDDSYQTDQDTALTIAASGVLGNDTDVDGDALTASLVGGPSHGLLTLNSDGSFTYTPESGYFGDDSFVYLAHDGANDSNPATVWITVNRANALPVSTDDYFDVDEDQTLTVSAPGVLSNDSDPDLDPLTTILVEGPAHGQLTFNADGSLSYSPNANYSGGDSFTYRANDGFDQGNVAIVHLTIQEINDAPVALGDSYTLDQDSVLTVPVAQGVLANDSDIESDPLTALLVDAPSHGALSLSADGSLTYTPAAGYEGADSFTYRASDGSAFSNTVTVSLSIEGNSQTALYVSAIDFESKRGDQDWRVVVTIRSEGGEAVAGVGVTVLFAGKTYSGTTDATGQFRGSWIKSLPSGDYYANVADMAFDETYFWNPLQLDLEDDSDGDGLPDELLSH